MTEETYFMLWIVCIVFGVSFELASKCQKPVVVTLLVWCLAAWDVLPGGLGCVAWRLRVCYQVIHEN